MRIFQTHPIPFYFFIWAFIETSLKWIQLAINYYFIEYKYYYSRRLYFRFIPRFMKSKFSNILPQQKSNIKLREETKKWLIIYLIKFGKFSCEEIKDSLICLNLNGITSKVVEDVFKENILEFRNLPIHYISQFNKKEKLFKIKTTGLH